MLPEYQRDDGGLNVKLCSPRSSRANQDGGTGERLQASGSIKPGVYVLALDGCVLHSAASQGAPIPSRGWMRSDGWSGQSRVGEQTGILSMQLRRLSNPNPTFPSKLRSNRTSFTREPPVQRHLTGSAPGLVFFFSLPPALIGCAS